jgi:hypothetical protein
VIEIEEDDGWGGWFAATYAYAKSREGLKQRMKAYRRANRTVKQRQSAIKKKPKKQVNFRATDETIALVKAMSANLDSDDTDMIARAIHAFAESHLPGAKK